MIVKKLKTVDDFIIIDLESSSITSGTTKIPALYTTLLENINNNVIVKGYKVSSTLYPATPVSILTSGSGTNAYVHAVGLNDRIIKVKVDGTITDVARYDATDFAVTSGVVTTL